MKKKIFLHIGPHKTGTTTIQIGLKHNENMLEKHKILCPNTGRTSQQSVGNHNLAWVLLYPQIENFNPKFGTWDDFHNEVINKPKAKKIIITSEDFSSLDLNQISHLREILKNFDVKVILYLRRQDKILQSTWVEVVRNAWTKVKVESFFDWVDNNNYSATTTDYLSIIKKWETVFSKEDLILKIFNPSNFKGTLLEDFLLSCEIKINKIINPPNANVSPGVKTIEAIRLIKANLNFSEFDRKSWNFLVECITSFGDKYDWNNSKINYLNKDLSEKIMNCHRDTNKIIAKEYFQRDCLFKEDSIIENSASKFLFEDFSKDEIIHLFSYLLTRIDQKHPHIT
ncbi:MAG: hypothetical protein P1P73_11510 [Brevefilum sp.]|nr:hypothetical protein [Brevefilum sp.]